VQGDNIFLIARGEYHKKHKIHVLVLKVILCFQFSVTDYYIIIDKQKYKNAKSYDKKTLQLLQVTLQQPNTTTTTTTQS
jgi:hypothetical protein